MKLGIDGREYQSAGRTGIGRYLADFIEWTAANRPDIKITVFLNQRCRYTPPPHNVETVTINENITQVWDQILLPRALGANGINVFVSPYFKMPMFAPCPVVLIINDLIPIRLPASQSGASALSAFYTRVAALAAVRRAARFITISEFTRQEAIKQFRIPDTSISAVPLGISEILAPEPNAENIHAFTDSCGLDKPYILYFGQFRATKNVAALIRAYAILPDKLRETYLLAIGGGKTGEYPRLVELANETGIGNDVRFIGYVEDNDLPALLSGAALFVYPSLYEGFGFPPLEAMACGAPVVSSNATSLAEILGDAAVAVDPPSVENLAATIENTLADAALIESLKIKGVARARNFTIERMALGFLKVIES
jgi:glycosyltransferase involved in cell wall biosynthesis